MSASPEPASPTPPTTAQAFDGLARELSAAITSDHLANIWEDCRMPGHRAIASLHDRLLSVLFPGVFGGDSVTTLRPEGGSSSGASGQSGLTAHLTVTLNEVAQRLSECIAIALEFFDRQKPNLLLNPGAQATTSGSPESTVPAAHAAVAMNQANYAERGRAIAGDVLRELPAIRILLSADLQAAYEGDPAASSVGEVLLSYPCVQAIATHRIAHALYQRRVPLLPRMLSEVAHSRTGIDIHPGATIGPGFFIDHGTGVVIGETTVIGRQVKLYQGVTLGARSFSKDDQGLPIKGIKRHPNIEDNVTLYAGATVLGGDTTIGRNSVIGGNCWVTASVPPDTVVMAEPAKLRHR
jgi:serine O-acetyltransferase